MGWTLSRETALLVLGMFAAAAFAQPAAPVRVIAEWEPALGTLVSWPFDIPEALVVELAQDDDLFVLVTGSGAENQAAATLAAWGVDPGRVHFIHTSVQTEWTRDWGPHQIFDGNGDWAIIDPVFEGYPWVPTPCQPITSPGGYNGDDAVNLDVAAHFGAPLHALPAYLVGGNFLVDGHQAAFSTCAMVGENQQLWTEAQFLQLAQDYCGISDYHVVNNTEDHGIQHIDCWMKVLDEETLLVKRPPAWHEEHARIEQNLQQLAGATNAFGRPYRILRIDCPPYSGERIAAYTNSLILNRKVLVPLFDIPGDGEALQTWADVMPGYEVIGFPYSAWYYYDALHCRTRAIFDRHMLRITHARLPAEIPVGDNLDIVAKIDDRSEAGLLSDQLAVKWRAGDGESWQSVELVPTGNADEYGATIPAQPAGTTVQYYVVAADQSGRSETLPRTAPAGLYRVDVIDTGLTINVPDPPVRVEPWALTPFNVVILPGDEALVPDSVRLRYRFDGGVFLEAPLTPAGGNEFVATLPRAVCDDSPQFYVTAMGTQSGVKTWPHGAPGHVFDVAVGTTSPITLLAEDFEAGLPVGWAASGLWHATGACGASPACDGQTWAYFGLNAGCTYATGGRARGTLTAPAVTLPSVAPAARITLTYCSRVETEGAEGFDLPWVLVNGRRVDEAGQSVAWETRTVDLTAFAGQTVTLAWQFDSIDNYYNDHLGWQVDAVELFYEQVTCDFELPYDSADANCDGTVNAADIDPFVLALTDPAGYHAAYPGCTLHAADCNSDGAVNAADIDPFVQLLTR